MKGWFEKWGKPCGPACYACNRMQLGLLSPVGELSKHLLANQVIRKRPHQKKKKLCVLECCSYSSFCLSGQTCLAFRSLLAHSTTHSLFFLDKVVKLVTSLLIGWLLSPTVFAVIRFSLALSPSLSRFSGWARLQGEGRFGMMNSQRKNADNRSQ